MNNTALLLTPGFTYKSDRPKRTTTRRAYDAPPRPNLPRTAHESDERREHLCTRHNDHYESTANKKKNTMPYNRIAMQLTVGTIVLGASSRTIHSLSDQSEWFVSLFRRKLRNPNSFIPWSTSHAWARQAFLIFLQNEQRLVPFAWVLVDTFCQSNA